MSSLPGGLQAQETQGNCRVPGVSSDDAKEKQEAPLNGYLDALLYQDGTLKHLTHNALQLVEEAKANVGEANSLFLEGLLVYRFNDASFKYFSEAKKQGCTHPVLYHFMAKCYTDGRKGAKKNDWRALQYYILSVGGGCTWGLAGISSLYRDTYVFVGGNKEAFHCLLELEIAGYVDGYIHHWIGESYRYGRGVRQLTAVAINYYERAIDLGYAPSYTDLSATLWRGGNAEDKTKAVLSLLAAEESGLGVKDDRILRDLIVTLQRHQCTPNAQILGNFKSTGEMVLHYCDVLIQRKSPFGYYWKGLIYIYGGEDIPLDQSKAVSIFEEADRVGLADFGSYSHLQTAYMKGRGGPVNGTKALEYGEKALQVADSELNMVTAYERIIAVYTQGIHPVKQDGSKALECCDRALQLATEASTITRLYTEMAHVYKMGIHPIPEDGAKALELYDKAAEAAPYLWKPQAYCRMADVYKEGIHPIPQDGAKALEYYEKALRIASDHKKPSVYQQMAEVYEKGIPPIAVDLARARDLRQRR